MENPQRATIAFLCGCLNNVQIAVRYNSVYDYAQSAYVQCSFSNNGGSVSIFDYKRHCYLTGRFPSFYDYGVSQYITLSKVGGNAFSIFDYLSQSYLSVNCHGNTVTIFDYSRGQYFNYTLN